MPFTCYRVVKSWPPQRHDLESDQAKHKPPRPAQLRDPRLYAGISVFEATTFIEAIRQRVPLPGVIVELVIPDGAPVAVHKTLSPGHWTVIGDPDHLLGCVVRLV